MKRESPTSISGRGSIISVTVSDNLAEQLQELKKGDMVFVRGSLRQRDYESNGQKKTVYEIRARQIQTIDQETYGR